ncbi:hypothetical protein F2P79_019223 [Pimephales promelas]|nr:hypothetical protein F2P79_019223 [Pimephales promelas]
MNCSRCPGDLVITGPDSCLYHIAAIPEGRATADASRETLTATVSLAVVLTASISTRNTTQAKTQRLVAQKGPDRVKSQQSADHFQYRQGRVGWKEMLGLRGPSKLLCVQALDGQMCLCIALSL